MSTFSRLSRFDQTKLSEIYFSGSVDYSIGDFNLMSINTESDDPNNALFTIPIISPVFDTSALNETFDLEFREFVDETPIEEISASPTSDELEMLKYQLDSAEQELIEKKSVEQLNLAQKELIIRLRTQLGEDTGLGFNDEYPYDVKRLNEDE